MTREDSIKELLRKAQRSIEVARSIEAGGSFDFSVSRAYYAMFYCAQALLFHKGLSFAKHSAVIAAFGKEFIKGGILPSHLHRYLSEAFDDRMRGDYDLVSVITAEKSQETLKRAERFLKATEDYLGI
jgi:uncharacterized protein (UPF0332 family)